jgi:hypothetical protein
VRHVQYACRERARLGYAAKPEQSLCLRDHSGIRHQRFGIGLRVHAASHKRLAVKWPLNRECLSTPMNVAARVKALSEV